MKNTIIIIMAILFSTALNAQTLGIQPVLDSYLKVKDALVKSDAKKAAEYANGLVATINKVDEKQLKDKEQKAFKSSKDDLLKAAQKVAKTSDLEKQRTAFADLSPLVWQLVKDAESASQQVYYDYCPMKKTYWLSTDSAIKNPYYGATMLTCGNISDQKEK